MAKAYGRGHRPGFCASFERFELAEAGSKGMWGAQNAIHVCRAWLDLSQPSQPSFSLKPALGR